MNVATEDVTELNGPLEIAPGTHKNDLPYWKFVVHKKRKRILLSRGDIIIRSSALWHRGTKNISRKPRFLLAFTFRDKNKSELNSDNFNQININGSKSYLGKDNNEIKIYKNVFDSSLRGKIQENFYTRFSYLYSTARLLKSLIPK